MSKRKSPLNENQFRFLHSYVEQPEVYDSGWDDQPLTIGYGGGEVEAIHRDTGEVAARLGYGVGEAWDHEGRPIRGSREINSIDRATEPAYQRQGLQTRLQEILEQSHEGTPITSYGVEFSPDAEKFHKAYKKRHPKSPWSVRYDVDRY